MCMLQQMDKQLDIYISKELLKIYTWLENGDYITTTELAPGYGVKQDDDLLHNYTVAKITQNEDFSDMTDPEFSRIFENGVKCKFVGSNCFSYSYSTLRINKNERKRK